VKTKIVVGSLLAVFLLMMLPSVPAVEFNTVVETNKSNLLEEIQNIDIDELKEKLKNPNGFAELIAILIELLFLLMFIVEEYLGITLVELLTMIYEILKDIFGYPEPEPS